MDLFHDRQTCHAKIDEANTTNDGVIQFECLSNPWQ